LYELKFTVDGVFNLISNIPTDFETLGSLVLRYNSEESLDDVLQEVSLRKDIDTTSLLFSLTFDEDISIEAIFIMFVGYDLMSVPNLKTYDIVSVTNTANTKENGSFLVTVPFQNITQLQDFVQRGVLFYINIRFESSTV
jgi:hypothetical protein